MKGKMLASCVMQFVLRLSLGVVGGSSAIGHRNAECLEMLDEMFHSTPDAVLFPLLGSPTTIVFESHHRRLAKGLERRCIRNCSVLVFEGLNGFAQTPA